MAASSAAGSDASEAGWQAAGMMRATTSNQVRRMTTSCGERWEDQTEVNIRERAGGRKQKPVRRL